MELTIGTRCYEHDRGEELPRGGIVIAVLEPLDQVVVLTAHGRHTEGRKPNVPFVNVAVLPIDVIDPATIEPLQFIDRVRVVRAIAGVMSVRRVTGWTPEDDRDLNLIRALLAPAPQDGVDPRLAHFDPSTGEAYAAGMTKEPAL